MNYRPKFSLCIVAYFTSNLVKDVLNLADKDQWMVLCSLVEFYELQTQVQFMYCGIFYKWLKMT